MNPSKKLPVFLLALYLVEFSVLAFAPFDRTVWWVENLTIIPIVVTLVLTFPYFQFSALSYILMSFLIFFHTIGGHYTFERVPFYFIDNLFGFHRNMYDRMAHFTVGFYAYPIAELLYRKRLVNSSWILTLFPIFCVFGLASMYEIFEWRYAVSADPTAGIAVLGSQGDIWDAQKDMLSDGLGAIAATILFWILHFKRIRKTGYERLA